MLLARIGLCGLLLALGISLRALADESVTLPNTKPLEVDGDLAMEMVAGVDKFLLRKTKESLALRAAHWKLDFSSDAALQKALEPNRQRLAQILGVVDARLPSEPPEILGTTKDFGRIATAPKYDVYAIRWRAFGEVHGEGLLLVPRGIVAQASVVAIPDADQTPEQITGLSPGLPPQQQFARILADNGCRVVVPTLISRELKPRNGRATMTHREFIYRPAFTMGRHIIGYEIQKVLAAVDWFVKEADNKDPRIGVIGYGEGGLLAFYAGALDTRIDATCVSGYFGLREAMWKHPLDRNLFGMLERFGDAEVGHLFRHRHLNLINQAAPEITVPSSGGAPGVLKQIATRNFAQEVLRAAYAIDEKEDAGAKGRISVSAQISSQPKIMDLPEQFAKSLGIEKLEYIAEKPEVLQPLTKLAERQERQLHELDRHTQQLLAESPYVRAEFMKGLDTSSPEKYAQTVEGYREKFKRETIGWFDDERLPLNPRTRRIIDQEQYSGYEVQLDLWPEVFAYGVLLLPKNIPAGERRPVVVCQHGLEGRPLDTIQGNHAAYHDFAAKLCERGFIVFCPQNLYLGGDKFRTLQRKANPLGKTLFSIIIPQHQQIVAWLKTLPEVDEKRIAFYGLSYGGKSAMRIPPLVPEYCLSICSADFNDWVWKNASTRSPYSYVWTGEYEIFEWNLGHTFNYAEMAALIAPRPFMVERGHFDGVAPDEAVASEFAKVRHLYAARLKIPDRCEIEFFDGPHTINGKGTFAFLHKHLQWPEPKP